MKPLRKIFHVLFAADSRRRQLGARNRRKTRPRHVLGVEALEFRQMLATFAVDGVQFTTIQSAIDAAAANPGDDQIEISPGTYDENPNLNDQSGGLVLRGISGNAAEVVIDGGSRNDVVKATVAFSVTFENLTITRGGNTQVPNDASAGRGLNIRGGGDLLLQNVFVANNRSAGLTGLNVPRAGTVRVSGGDFSNNRNGIFLQGFSAVEVDNATANQNSLGGLYADNSGDITVTSSEFSANLDNGIDLRSVGNISLHDVVVADNGTNTISGLFVSAASSLGIRDSSFSGSAGPGIVAISVAGETELVDVAAEGNTGRAAFIQNGATAGPVTILGGSYSHNDGGGLGLTNTGDVSIASAQFVGNGPLGNTSGGGIRIESTSPASVTISGVAVSGNIAGVHGGGIFINVPGSALKPVIIRDSTIAENRAGFSQGAGDGGGIYLANSTNQATIERSRIQGNRSLTQSGGGVKSLGGLTILDSTVAGNSAPANGGGLQVTNSSLTVQGSTLSGNSAGTGGGIAALGVVSILNSTLSGNSATSSGGALYLELASFSLAHSTIASNVAPVGGAIALLNSRTATVEHSIIAGNTINPSTGETQGFVSSLGYNLVGAAGPNAGFNNATDQTGTIGQPLDAKLAPLADNGGLTQTHALLPGSPAVDAGSPNSSLAVDQRGLGRPEDGDRDGLSRIDIGAYETHLPTAANDAYELNEDEELTAPAPGVLSNDTDANGLPLTVELLDPPSHGLLTLEADGSFVYTPDANFNGVDSFTYRATNGIHSSEEATVTLTIVPVNDDPVAVDAVFELAENSANGMAVGVVSAADVDGDALSFALSGPDAAAFAIDAQTGVLSVADSALLDFEAQGRFDFLVAVSDGNGGQTTASVRVDLTDVLEVAIDILPSDPGNTIRLDSSEIEVAILGAANFDPLAMLDLGTLRLRAPDAAAGAGVAFHHRHGFKYEQRDVNGDGILDLVVRFKTADTGLQAGDTSVRLEGNLKAELGGEFFSVDQTVSVVAGRKKGGGKGQK